MIPGFQGDSRIPGFLRSRLREPSAVEDEVLVTATAVANDIATGQFFCLGTDITFERPLKIDTCHYNSLYTCIYLHIPSLKLT